MPPKVSFLMPLFNEADHVTAALQSIVDQTYPRGEIEIVIALAESTDGTAEAVQGFCEQNPEVSVRVLENRQRNTAVGRNICLEAASGSLVMNFSGHAVAEPNMLEVLVAKLEGLPGNVAGIGCGIDRSPGTTPLARAISVCMFSRMGGARQVDSSFNATRDQPARSIAFALYKKDILDDVGGFDPAFWCGQDAELNLRLARSGYELWFTPDTRVRHHKRDSLTGFAVQMCRYGVARAKLTNKYPGSLRMIFLLPVLFMIAVIAAVVGSFFSGAIACIALGAAVVFVLSSVVSAMTSRGGVLAVLLSPLLYSVMYVCFGGGFLWGFLTSGDDRR
jgi:glycosyltransferase involved in cell wall biosynthesis